ncbi:Mus38-like protein [Pleurostoma richardsiae]|uniref:Mus38-like protein n=1 Tax=Pleurostoma richardsiae TaxID=41990 RepID=A0AA38R809_9PEZI|nr:Mus38-like protein [Pleurostoma richardsiae]
MTTHYSPGNAISSFFKENTGVTRQQCDDFTVSYVGGRVNPVQIQGAFSYSLTAGTNKLFQFRVHDSRIDMSILSLAKAVHPQFVAGCKYHGTIGQSQPLHIYEMDKLPGTAYIMALDISSVQPSDAVFRQRNTTKDLAKFFAQSWNNGQRLCPEDIAALLAEFRNKFDLLARSLPARFLSNLDRIREELPSLFSGALPYVLSHQDLCEMNILTNTRTGNITGIVDCAEARILPFGFSLWGFENILGYMDSKGWHYYDNCRELQERSDASKVEVFGGNSRYESQKIAL